MKAILRKSLAFVVVLFFISSPVLLLAQGAGGTPGIKIEIPSPLSFCARAGDANCSLITLIQVLIDSVVVPVGGAVVVVMIIYSGFLFVTARGNAAQIETARRSILYAAIGAVILLGARVIALAIKGTITQLGS